MIDLYWLQCITFESPAVEMLGPLVAALFANFAIMIGDQVFLTEAGELYLKEKEQ